MIGASKILTVSYGTFSCTLEGFEDPFNTMKAIAEYFRDLAAEDRYFGAEPPTPDAAMLHRIAEREIQRRVEAKIQDNGVILRAAEIAEPVAPVAAPAPQPAAAAPAAAPGALLAEESVAAKLQRIRSAVARSAAAAAAAPAIEDAEIEDAVIAAEPAPAPEPAAESLVAAWSAAEEAEASAEPETLAVAAEPEEIVEPEVTAVAEEVGTAEAEEDSVVEAVLGEAAWTDEAADILPEDRAAETAEDLPEATPEELDEALAEALALETAAPLVLTEAEAAPEAEAEADLSDVLAQLETVAPDEAAAEDETVMAYAEAPAVTVADEADEAAFEAPAEPAAAAPAEAYDDEIFEDDAFATAAQAAAPAEEPALEPFEDEIAPAAAEAQSWPADPEAPVAAPEVSDKLRRARARVIKVRRPEPTEAALPPEAEAELQRELAAAASEDEAGRRAESEGRSILEAAASGDEDVTRLLRQTNTEMEGPESKRRMSTLAHLKAAVAATVAELRAPSPSAGTGEPSRLERYRADLARVVRPRRSGDAAPTERPAPLVLVSEQRIDRPSNTDAVPTRVMPRRVSSGNLALEGEEATVEAATETEADNIFASSKSFAEFAERLGASEMPDLLEAAAAYTSCIEGRPHFSRPHLMRYVAAVADEATLGREDGLRSFGQLLRQGKIEKVKRGQFAITDMSYYLAEARRMTR